MPLRSVSSTANNTVMHQQKDTPMSLHIFINRQRHQPWMQCLLLLPLLFLLAVDQAVAAQPMQQKRVVLQLTDNTPEKQTLVLNVADNFTHLYGDKLDLEIVVYGPGLQLLFAENKNDQRINRLAKQGVRFSACRNTAKKMEKVLGSDVKLHTQAKEVEAGAARIIELVEQGYILLTP